MFEPIEFLAWDSQFFGRSVGKLKLKAASSLHESLLFANQQRYELLYIYCPVTLEETLIGNYALLDVGGRITFTKQLSDYQFPENLFMPEIDECQIGSLTPDLLEIAYLSGHMSRFKIDTSLPANSFEHLYATWLAKALEDRPVSAIYTYNYDGRIVGLITAEWHEHNCAIGLLAVLQSYQGIGIASRLIRYVEDICISKKVISIEVKTQLSNTSARALYLRNSFAEHERSFLYHAHNP